MPTAMIAHPLPFPDELLSSWSERRTKGRPTIVRSSDGPRLFRRSWRQHNPDYCPSVAWLAWASAAFKVETRQLAGNALRRRYKAMRKEFVAWLYPPTGIGLATSSVIPCVRVAWCNRCLAEDLANARPAYFRQCWALAPQTFCHKHRWPLEERCNICGAYNWTVIRTATNCVRLVCGECWRPLERSMRAALDAPSSMLDAWDRVIALEAEILAALSGRTPDQFRFNFTSGAQLLNEVDDIAGILCRNYWGYTRTNIPLNAFSCPAITPGYLPQDFYESDGLHPLATGSIRKRRSLLGAICAILDPDPTTGRTLYGPESRPSIEEFVSTVERAAIEIHISAADRWSPSFISRLNGALRALDQKRKVSKLAAIWSLRR